MAIGDGANVGDVHLEGHLEYDGSRTPAFMSAMRRDLQRHLPDIGKDLQKTFGDATEKGITDGGNKGLSALEKKLKSLNVKAPGLDVPVAKALADIDRVETELKELGRTAATAKVRIDSQSALGDLARLRKSLQLDETTTAIKQRLDIDVEKDKAHYQNIGKAVGMFLAVGTSMGFKDHARLIRDAMVVGGFAAASAAIVGLSGLIQAAFAVAPAALVAMPSLFLGVASAAGVAALALADFKDLLKLAFTPGQESLDELNAKMKDLVPKAREFFLELHAGQQAFHDLGGVAHNEFYIPLKDNAAGIILLFQSLKDEVALVAEGLGTLASRFLNVATSASSIHAFEAVMQGTRVFLDTVGPSAARLFDALIQKAREGAGYAESFGIKIASVFDYMTNWLNTHSLAELFDDAKPALEDLHRIALALWGTLKNLFGGDWSTGGGGPLEMFADIAEAIERASAKIRAFIEMVAGLPPHVKELIGYGAALAALSVPLGGVVSWFSKIAQHARDFALGISALGVPLSTVSLALLGIGAALVALGLIFITAWTRSEEFRDKIRATFTEIQDFWNNYLKPSFEEIRTSIADIFTDTEQLLAEFGLDWGDLGSAIQQAARNIMGFITMMVDGVKFGLEIIKGQLALAKTEVELFQEAWEILNRVWDENIAPALNRIKEGFQQFWDTLVVDTGLADAILGLFDRIGGWFREGWDRAMAVLEGIKEAWLGFWRGFIQGDDGVISSGVTGFFERIGSAARSAWERLLDILNGIKEAWDGFWRGFLSGEVTTGGVAGMFERIGSALRTGWESIVKPVLETIGRGFKETLATLFDVGEDIGSSISSTFDRVGSSLRSAWDNVIKPALDSIKQGFKDSMASLFEGTDTNQGGIVGAFERIGDAIRSAWNDKIKPALDDLKGSLGGLADAVQPSVDRLRGIWDSVKDAWSNAIDNEIKPSLTRLKDALNELKDSIQPSLDRLKNAWTEIKDAWNTAYNNDIKPSVDRFKESLQELRDKWDEVWEQKIKPAIDSFVKKWREELKPALDELKATFDELVQKLDGAGGSFDKLKDKLAPLAPQFELIALVLGGAILVSIMGFIASLTLAVEQITATIEIAEKFGQIVGDVFTKLRETATDVWNWIKSNVFEPIGAFLRDTLTAAFNGFKDAAIAALNAIRDGAIAWWNAIRDGVFSPIQQFLAATLGPAFEGFKTLAINVFNAIRDGISSVWHNGIKPVLDTAIGFIKGPLVQAFDGAKNSIVGIWETMHRGLSATWDKILAAGRDKINALIGLVNGVIDIINKIPGIDKIDKLSQVGAPAAGAPPSGGRSPFRRAGGPVEGGPTGVDTVPAWGPGGSPQGQRYWLDNGEHIWTRREVQNAGGHRAMERMRSMFRSGYTYRDGPGLSQVRMADGGVVDPDNLGTRGAKISATQVAANRAGATVRVGADNNALLEQHRDHVHVAMNVPPMGYNKIIEIASKSGFPYRVTSTFRPGSRGSGGGLDHHSTGRAVDFGGFNQDAFAAFWERTAGVIELIHRTNLRDYAIFGGKGRGGFGLNFFSWLDTPAGKAAKKLLEGIINNIKNALPKEKGLVPNPIRAIFGGIANKAMSIFEEKAGFTGAAGSAAPPEQLKKWIEEAQKYVKIESIGGLLTLIMRESGGNPRAINLWDSNAQKGTPSKGLMQTIDPTFRAHRDPRLPNDPFDPVANIVAGMNYIHSRYGSLFNVQQANAGAAPKGYDLGGVLPPGPTLAYNKTGAPETVLNPRHSAFVGKVLAGENLVVENYLYVDGEPIRAISRQEVHVREQEKDRIEQAGVRR